MLLSAYKRVTGVFLCPQCLDPRCQDLWVSSSTSCTSSSNAVCALCALLVLWHIFCGHLWKTSSVSGALTGFIKFMFLTECLYVFHPCKDFWWMFTPQIYTLSEVNLECWQPCKYPCNECLWCHKRWWQDVVCLVFSCNLIAESSEGCLCSLNTSKEIPPYFSSPVHVFLLRKNIFSSSAAVAKGIVQLPLSHTRS